MDPISFVAGVSASYNLVMRAYDLYLDVRDFSTTYRNIRMCLQIERYRLELWASLMHLKEENVHQSLSARDLTIWVFFKLIVDSMLRTLQESHEMMEKIGLGSGMSTQGSDLPHELLGGLSLSASEKPKWNPSLVYKKITFLLRNQDKMRDLVKQLCYYNDSLEKMTSQLEREKLHRQLRTQFVTVPKSEIAEVQEAATLLEHGDLLHLTNARMRLEETAKPDIDGATLNEPDSDSEDTFCMSWGDVNFKTSHHITVRPRAIAEFNNEQVIIDWRASEDDVWRTQNPRQFRQRKENLTKILNRDLQPLNLAVLPCVGYLNQSKTVTGYAFRLPPHVQKADAHWTLYDLMTQDIDLPDLGERFLLAQAMVRTVCAIQSINWLHKNISSRNILIWPKQSDSSTADILHPYLMGFDIARSNDAVMHSEAPLRNVYDEHYRHPKYRERLEAEAEAEADSESAAATSPDTISPRFWLSFDIYSLGVLLYEIGIWSSLSHEAAESRRKGSAGRKIMQGLNTDSGLVQRYLAEDRLKELKRRMGHRYAKVVVSCLNCELDEFWDDEARERYPDPSIQLQQYLKHVQTKIIEPLAICSA